MPRLTPRSSLFVLVVVAASVASVVVWRKYGLEHLSWIWAPLAGMTGIVVLIEQVTKRHEPSTEEMERRRKEALAELANAVAVQWGGELDHLYRVHDASYLPVTWSDGEGILAADWGAIQRSDHPVPVSLSGSWNEIVDVYRRVTSGQLIVLGEPGAGKTVLALWFALRLLSDAEAEPPRIPVFLNIAGWRPPAPDTFGAPHETLTAWIVDEILAGYPRYASSKYVDKVVTQELLARHLILPVLDGLDELPEDLQSELVTALNRQPNSPFLLTARASDYAHLVSNEKGLRRAASIVLNPLTGVEVANYLKKQAPAGRQDKWADVIAELRAHPDAHLADVFRTPLMVAVVRDAYLDPATDPSELLDVHREDGVEAVESLVLDRFVSTAFAESRRRGRWPFGGTDLARGEKWLAFLAWHLSNAKRRDLSWWDLRRAVPPQVWALAATVGAVGVMALAGILLRPMADRLVRDAVLAEYNVDTIVDWLRAAWPGVTVFVAVLGATIAYALNYKGEQAKRAPSRVTFRGGLRAVRRDLPAALQIGLALGGVVGVVFYIFHLAIPASILDAVGRLGVHTDSSYSYLKAGMTVAVAAVLYQSAKSGLRVDFSARTDTARAVSPFSLVRTDRTAFLLALLPNMATVAALIVVGSAALTVADQESPTPSEQATAIVGLGLLVWAVSNAHRPWPTLLVVRIHLALTRRLPLRIGRFLVYCHRDLLLLRQVGGVYQFRHAKLQDRLAVRMEEALATTDPQHVIAELLLEVGFTAEAIADLQRVVSTRIDRLGLKHPDTYVAMCSLTDALLAANQFERAEVALHTRLEMAIERGGDEAEDVPEIYLALAGVVGGQRGGRELLPIVEELIAFEVKWFGNLRRPTAYGIADVLVTHGQFVEAGKIIEKCEGGHSSDDSPGESVAVRERVLGHLAFAEGRYEEAATHLRAWFVEIAADVGYAAPSAMRAWLAWLRATSPGADLTDAAREFAEIVDATDSLRGRLSSKAAPVRRQVLAAVLRACRRLARGRLAPRLSSMVADAVYSLLDPIQIEERTVRSATPSGASANTA
ncbi:NACHT domain-containing protein [Micromonospora sp. CPCC 205371]|nr:NACHT domain-containing protein [Micromonospora sp. CPCC 205371]